MAIKQNEQVKINAEVICKEHLGQKRYFVRIHYDSGSRPEKFIDDLILIGFSTKHERFVLEPMLKALNATQYIVDMTKEGSAPGGDWTTKEQMSNMDKMESVFERHGVRWFPRRWREDDLP